MKIIATLIALTLLVGFSFSQSGIININQSDLGNYPEICTKSDEKFSDSKKVRVFQLNKQIVKNKIKTSDKVLLEMFEGSSFYGVIDRISTNINNTLSVRISLTDYPLAYCIINVSENGLSFLQLHIPELREKYTLLTNTNSRQSLLVKHDYDNMDIIPGGKNPATPPMDDNESTNNKETPYDNKKDGKSENTRIDVMVVYTPAAADWASINEGGIENTVAGMMDITQLAVDASNVYIDFNLVHAAEVDYVEAFEDAYTDLRRLTFHPGFDPWSYGEGYTDYMQEVHDWRDVCGADLIVFVVKTDQVGGLGWLLQNYNGFPDMGLCLVRVQNASWSQVAPHEIGHNMGCHHHAEQASSPGPTDWSNWPGGNTWSAGWRWQGTDDNYYISLMSYWGENEYGDGFPSTPVLYFSNPDITHQGQPVGHSTLADNVRTLNEIREVVAGYRNPLEVDCPPDFSVYHNSNVVQLSGGTPEGGEYSGPGVNNGFFDPELAGVGVHEIEYDYTTWVGCGCKCSFFITVQEPYEITCPDNISVCINDDEFELTGALPEGGYYFGVGVTNTYFFPSVAGVGTHEISYSYQVDPENQVFCTFEITVNELPDVSCPEDFEVDIESGDIVLSGGMPEGGYYSGTAVSNGIFNTEEAGEGSHIITYTYSDTNTNCEANCDFQILVSMGSDIKEYKSDGLVIYPNPGDGTFIIESEEFGNEITLKVYDNKGSLVKSNIVNINSKTKKLKLDAAPGVYYLNIFDESNVVVRKLVIQP